MSSVTNFFAAMLDAAESAAAGKPTVASETHRAARVAVCRDCPMLDAPLGQCGVCDCYVSLKAKLLTESCPQGRWAETDKKFAPT